MKRKNARLLWEPSPRGVNLRLSVIASCDHMSRLEAWISVLNPSQVIRHHHVDTAQFLSSTLVSLELSKFCCATALGLFD